MKKVLLRGNYDESVASGVDMASGVLHGEEVNYSSPNTEILAVIWTLQKFRHGRPLGRPFTLRTDCTASFCVCLWGGALMCLRNVQFVDVVLSPNSTILRRE